MSICGSLCTHSPVRMAGRTETSIIWEGGKKKSDEGNEDWADKAKNFSSSNDWTFLNLFIWSDDRARSEVQKEEQRGKEGASQTAEKQNGFTGSRSVGPVEAFRPLDQFFCRYELQRRSKPEPEWWWTENDAPSNKPIAPNAGQIRRGLFNFHDTP